MQYGTSFRVAYLVKNILFVAVIKANEIFGGSFGIT
jgi:hypothetical protein